MKIVFDAGAHIGEEIPGWFRLEYDKVIAVEPHKSLCDKIASRFPEVIIENVALWSEAGSRPMYFGGYTSLSTLVHERTEKGRFASYGWGHEEIVQTVTLDNLISKYGLPEHIKMDIEGAEKEALKGLSQPVDSISFEYLSETVGDAIECAKILSALAEYQFDITIGESNTHSRGLVLEEFETTIKDIASNPKNWGMILARRKT